MSKNNELGMKWYNFLIFFVLWFNGAILILSAILYFTGMIYESPSAIYTAAPMQQLIDQVNGALLVLFGIFCFITRSRLAKFKKGAPGYLYAFYILGNIVLPYLYAIASFVAMGSSSDMLILIAPDLIGTVIGTIIVVLINKVYFGKRAHLFVN